MVAGRRPALQFDPSLSYLTKRSVKDFKTIKNFKLHLFILCVCVCGRQGVSGWVGVPQARCRGQEATFWRLVSAPTILGLNSGSRAWQQTTLLVEPSYWPRRWFDAKKLETKFL